MAGPTEEDVLRVLVVADDEAVRSSLEYGFHTGVTVIFVADARHAWTEMQEQLPDAVVVDMQTGSAGGFSLTREMAADARFDSVPVMILLDREQDAWLARQAGADAWRVKPVEPARFPAEVAELAAATHRT